jgi:hypothetical protein
MSRSSSPPARQTRGVDKLPTLCFSYSQSGLAELTAVRECDGRIQAGQEFGGGKRAWTCPKTELALGLLVLFGLLDNPATFVAT